MVTSYLLILLLPLISYAVYYSLPSTYHYLSTTTHFQVDTFANTVSYNLVIVLSLRKNNFFGIRLDSVHTSSLIYPVRHVGFWAPKQPSFLGPKEVTWPGSNAVVCNISSVEYYRNKPMGEFSIYIKVYLSTRFNLGALTVPVTSTAECTVKLPLSTTSNGAYGGMFGPTKCG